jgi:hypothetical protein
LKIGGCENDSIESDRPLIDIEVCGVGNRAGGCENIISWSSSIPSKKAWTDFCCGEDMGDGDRASEV